MRKLFFAILLIATSTIPAAAKPIKVTAAPFTLSRFFPASKAYGQLEWKGGLLLQSSSNSFGGFSGIALDAKGHSFVAISDRGWWFTGTLTYKDGMLSGIGKTAISPIRTPKKSNYYRDAEAIAPWTGKGINGPLIVGFERHERISRYKYTRSRPRRIQLPKAVATGEYNGEMEAIGRFYSGPKTGWLLAISEDNLDKNGNLRAWLWKGKTIHPFSINRHSNYLITGLAVLPDGKSFVTIERSFSLPYLSGMAIRQFKTTDISPSKPLTGKLLFEGRQPSYALDNMEGIAVHRHKNGKLRLTVISDDNFKRSIQSTLIMQFEMPQAIQ